MMRRFLILTVALAACGGGTQTGVSTTLSTSSPTATSPATIQGEPVLIPPATNASIRNQLGFAFPEAPAVPSGPPEPALVEALDSLFSTLTTAIDIAAIDRIAELGDPRATWLLADLLSVLGAGNARSISLNAFERLTGAVLDDDPVAALSPGLSISDHLIAWDLPALEGYQDWKAQLFLLIEPRWEPFFDDADADIDWRHIGWGGVPMDARLLGDPNPCPEGCIPALDDPAVTDAAGGDWYADDRVVFGITIGGESRAYPKHIMEIHEMVNDTIGGRRVAIPYCTLCGSAQAYFTDNLPSGIETPLLRTSGLLTRSNKVMFDRNTFSVFDTFTGVAVSGPLRERGIELEQTSLVISTWGDWKLAHPDTTIVAEDGGIGRDYPLDPLGGRDDDGPIFPVGEVDERLGVQEKVLGVIADDGSPVAFPVAAARAVLEAGGAVEALGVVVIMDASGVRATDEGGAEMVGHEAFWFAWSQFHPETVVWALQ